MVLHKAKRKYQRAAWLQAYNQTRPSGKPPERVTVRATLYLCQLRDDDNGSGGSMKWVLDGLKQRQLGKHGKAPNLDWRGGVAATCGYFVDDDPARLKLLPVEQVRVGKRAEQRLELEILEVLETAEVVRG